MPWLKRETDLAALADLQRRLLDRAVALTRPGGTIVYCTCSLEPEEGEAPDRCCALSPGADSPPADHSAAEAGDRGVRDRGRRPAHPAVPLPDPDPRMAGLDGFYAARLERL